MRVARDERELSGAYETARNEADKAFGSPDVYLEKYLDAPRHIEFQIFGDSHGNVQHLGERECSIQRRHQKVIEEAPSPALTRSSAARWGPPRSRRRRPSTTPTPADRVLLDAQDRFYFME